MYPNSDVPPMTDEEYLNSEEPLDPFANEQQEPDS